MPSLQDIEKFNQTLTQLGHEPAIRAERGESMEPVEAPEQGLTPDLDELLDFEEEGGEEEAQAEEGARPQEEAAPSEEASEEAPVEEGLDFSGLEEEGELGDLDLEGFGEENLGEEDFPLSDFAALESEAGEEAPPAEEAPVPEAPEETFPEPEAQEEPEAGALVEEELGLEAEIPEEDLFGEGEEGEEFPSDEEFALPEEFEEGFPDEEFQGLEEEAPVISGEAEASEAEAAEFEVPEDELEAPGAPEAGAAEEEETEELGFGDLDFEAEVSEETEAEAPEEPGAQGEEEPSAPAAEAPEEEAGPAAEAPMAEAPEDEFTSEELFGGDEAFSFEEEAEEGIETPSEEFVFEEEPEEEGFVFEEEPREEGGGEGFSFEEPEAGDYADTEGLDEDLESVDEGVGDVDEFDLGDFGAEFGVMEEEGLGTAEEEEELNPALDVSEVPEGEVREAGAEEVELDEKDFDEVKRTLARLPLNVKLEAEEAISETKLDSDEISKLLDLLKEGESAPSIANYLSKRLGKHIRVPKGYEKRTGRAFEEERRTFAYAFRENILPVLRVLSLSILVLGALGYLGYRFVYRPIRAQGLYQQGIERIEADEYSAGNRNFRQAHDLWPQDSWFLTYADKFSEKRQYVLAEEKYDQLIAGMIPENIETMRNWLQEKEYDTILRVFDPPREGVLEYARLETEKLANFEKAETLLDLLLEENMYDYDALLQLGDTYMRWAQEEPERYEDARFSYATIIQQYGEEPEVLFRMLRYFMRTDNQEEVLRLKNYFQADKSIEVNPQVYAELGGYLIDEGLLDGINDILFRALDVNEEVPEAHYNLARYYHNTLEPFEEEKALTNALNLLTADKFQPLDRRHRAMLIDTYRRFGEYNYEREQYITAEEHFTDGIAEYERALNARIIEPKPEHGKLYEDLGNIYYYVSGEYEKAMEFFKKAENNAYSDPELSYKKGFISYRRDDLDNALLSFYESADKGEENENLLYAMGNTLFKRRNYFAAQGYYTELLDSLMFERSRIQNLFLNEDPEHSALIERIYKVQNNLGVTLNRLSVRQGGNDDKLSRSMVYLTSSSEYFVNYHRDPEELRRAETKDLAILNQRYIIYPDPNYELQIYSDIPKDFEDLSF